MGRSRGGLTTKIHLAADAQGRPLRITLTAGQSGDVPQAQALLAGAMAVIRHGRKTNFAAMPWLADVVERKPTKVVAVALANRIARTAWVLLATGGTYRQPGRTTV